MKLISRIFFLLLQFCLTRTLGIQIQSVPDVNNEGVIQVELNKTVSLVCGLDGNADTEADEELVWLRNGIAVKLMEGNKKNRSSVCVTPTIHEDNGATFTCQMSQNNTVKTSVTLNVTYLPQLFGSEEVKFEEMDELVLLCNIWANPPVSSVLWMLNGSLVDLVAGSFTVSNDGYTSQLKANRVERSLHQGTYQCTADGKHSKYFYVTVTERTIKFPLFPMIAALVVVCLTALLAIVSRWKKIMKCFK